MNRYLARAGLGSRRSVEALVLAGRVLVNGEVVTELGRRIDPAGDTVTLDGRPVAWPERWRTFAFHKPIGVISSMRPQGRTPCLDLYAGRRDLPPGVVPVGRLDAYTSGLLLWTDDGDLHQALCRPRSGVWKTYEVGLTAPLRADARPRLRDGGIVLDGRPCLPARLSPLDDGGRNWRMSLR
ncbi:rRNA pseudouridine synthase, partial [bacterium]|nr:rRNA pseudouridine synthase [bacterium]